MSKRMSPIFCGFICLWLISLTVGCATTSDKSAGDDSGGSKGSADSDSGGGVDTSGGRAELTVSLSNNPLTSHRVNKAAANDAAQKLQGSEDKASLETLLTADWLAAAPLDQVLTSARKLIDIEMKKDVTRDLTAESFLDLGLSAMRNKKYTLAEFFFDKAKDSKSPRTKAAAITADGMIAMLEGRVPEAVAAWNQALSVLSSFRPALLNVGFTTLKYGDFKTARTRLGVMEDDWFAASGLLVAERMLGNATAADRLCEKVLGKEPNHKPTLLSCGLLEWQSHHNYQKAKDYLERVVKNPGSGTGAIEERANRLLAEIDTDRSKAAQKAQKAKAATPAPAPVSKGQSDQPAAAKDKNANSNSNPNSGPAPKDKSAPPANKQ